MRAWTRVFSELFPDTPISCTFALSNGPPSMALTRIKYKMRLKTSFEASTRATLRVCLSTSSWTVLLDKEAYAGFVFVCFHLHQSNSNTINSLLTGNAKGSSPPAKLIFVLVSCMRRSKSQSQGTFICNRHKEYMTQAKVYKPWPHPLTSALT